MNENGAPILRWYGEPRRTYFVQTSTQAAPLQQWTFNAIIELGAGEIIPHEVVATADKAFFRLKYIDQVPGSGETIDTADYDGDGLENRVEIEAENQTDPLNADTDGDRLLDGWEVTKNLDPTDPTGVNGADGDPDDDGLPNLFEYRNGADPHLSDTDGDGLNDGDEVSIHQTSPTESDCDQDGLNDYAEVITQGTDPWDWDSDDDTLSDGDEINQYLTSPLEMDTDGDWMWDDYEIDHTLDPSDEADGLDDSDGDLLRNQLEFVFMDMGYDPFLINEAAEFPWADDPDWDGLSTQAEFVTYLTNPRQPDTDGDGLNDGWELVHGFNPKLNNAKAGPANQHPDADPDGDGLTNGDEEQLGSNPNHKDTDGDGVHDGVENSQGSNPNDPNDSAPPPNGTIQVNVTFGDNSGSHSEKYRVQLTPLEGDTGGVRFRTNRHYGQAQPDTFRLPKGAKYKVELIHIGTSPKYRGTPRPDYDYTLSITSGDNDPTAAVVVDDQQGIMGEHNESDSFFAKDKSADLYIAFMTSETVATLPEDRKRTKIGVTEGVQLTLHPASLPNPTWQLTGNVHLSSLFPATGITSLLTAQFDACQPVAEAAINGQVVKITFDAVEPTGIVMRREPNTGIAHTQGIPSAGFTGNPYITPNDVSFASGKVRVRELTCNGIGSGYYTDKNGDPHREGPWKLVVPGDATNPSKVDTSDHIVSGNDGPAVPAPGTFDWVIPMEFRADSWNAKPFTTITHHQECDISGTVSITKGAGPFSAQLNDPTYPTP